jgi:hypothetical protein
MSRAIADVASNDCTSRFAPFGIPLAGPAFRRVTIEHATETY